MKDDQLSIENARRAIAETYFLLGNKDKGEELFKGFLKDDPKWGWGWIGWSDQYWLWKKECADYIRGEEILLSALSIDGLRDRDNVEERLLDLYDDCGKDEKFKALEQRIKLKEEQRPSKPNQAMSEKVGRNSPCPCGSGYMYFIKPLSLTTLKASLKMTLKLRK